MSLDLPLRANRGVDYGPKATIYTENFTNYTYKKEKIMEPITKIEKNAKLTKLTKQVLRNKKGIKKLVGTKTLFSGYKVGHFNLQRKGKSGQWIFQNNTYSVVLYSGIKTATNEISVFFNEQKLKEDNPGNLKTVQKILSALNKGLNALPQRHHLKGERKKEKRTNVHQDVIPPTLFNFLWENERYELNERAIIVEETGFSFLNRPFLRLKIEGKGKLIWEENRNRLWLTPGGETAPAALAYEMQGLLEEINVVM